MKNHFLVGFKVLKENMNLNIFYLCKLTASIGELCGEYFISRYDKTWDLSFKNGAFEYSTDTSIVSTLKYEFIQEGFSGIRRHWKKCHSHKNTIKSFWKVFDTEYFLNLNFII